MNVELPAGLRRAIEAMLHGRERASLVERATVISDCYRGHGVSSQIIRSDDDVLTYVVTRMPATFAASKIVLSELRDRCAQFDPQSVLDVGAGPGTATWAALEVFANVNTVLQIDHNPGFLRAAKTIAARSDLEALRNSKQMHVDLARLKLEANPFDLVVAAYTFAEFPATAVPTLIRQLWKFCGQALVLIEPGTTVGYERILAARQTLIEENAVIVAPCPHANPCPLQHPDWCHFVVRLPRLRDHMLIKGGTLPYENEKFSYLIAARNNVPCQPFMGRILDEPKVDKVGFTAKVCTQTGLVQLQVRRRDKDQFRYVRKSFWGDAIIESL